MTTCSVCGGDGQAQCHATVTFTTKDYDLATLNARLEKTERERAHFEKILRDISRHPTLTAEFRPLDQELALWRDIAERRRGLAEMALDPYAPFCKHGYSFLRSRPCGCKPPDKEET